MEKIVKGMIRAAGKTRRIVRLERGKYEVIRVLDVVRVGAFTRSPQTERPPLGVEPRFIREVARVASQGAQASWFGRAALG